MASFHSALSGATKPLVKGIAFRSVAISRTRLPRGQAGHQRLQRLKRFGAVLARLARRSAHQDDHVAGTGRRTPLGGSKLRAK